MIYIFDTNAGDDVLNIKGELYKYLIKVRRHNLDDELAFRNKNNIKIIHLYKIIDLEPRSIKLKLISSTMDEVKSLKYLHIGWCVIDSKSIEKVLASLNEVGVSKISFIYCERSQKNFKLDFKRYERILEASMQQCGRSEMMELDTYKNLESFIREFSDVKVFDFTDNVLKEESDFQRVLIGCEGGFSHKEKELLKSQDVFRLNSPMILRSESAVMAVASKILL